MKNFPFLLMMAGIAMSASGCLKTPSLGKKPKSESSPAAEHGKTDPAPIFVQWKKIGDNPATYFPEGLPSDAPTAADDGEWFERAGARYFVPFRAAGIAEYADIVHSVPEGAERSESFASHLDPRKLIPTRDKPEGSEDASEAARTDDIWKAKS